MSWAIPGPPAPGMEAPKAETPANKTLEDMRKAIDDELSSGKASDKAKRLLESVDKLLDKLATSVDEAAKQEFIKSFLSFAAKFHRYSLSNQILIWLQKRDSTYVSGFKQWMEKGRQVMKWDEGITIIGSDAKKRSLTEDEKARLSPGSEKEYAEWRVYFPVTVYDISSTEPVPNWKGKEGQAPFEPPRLHSKDAQDEMEHVTVLVQAAMRFANSVGIKVDLEKEIEEQTGGYSGGKEIAVNKLYKGISQFGILAHEIAHEVLHQDPQAKRLWTRQEKEIDAETTAYIVLSHYGFESKSAPDYLALWKAKGEDVKRRRNQVSKAVQVIIKGINDEMSKLEINEEPTPEASPVMIAWVRRNCKFAAAAKPDLPEPSEIANVQQPMILSEWRAYEANRQRAISFGIIHLT